MDFAIWDPADYRVAEKNDYHIDDYWLCDFYFGYDHDAIEEDALNEKFCVQVLRILISKADEEIMELEADVVTLQSQLTWFDKDWSDLCSATLREKIDHLDILAQSLKKEIAEDAHFVGNESLESKKPAERLHDILKPLWENCFLMIQKQTETIIVQRSIQPADEVERLKHHLGHRKLKVKKCSTLMKNDECTGPFAEPEGRRIKYPKLKSNSERLTRNSEEKALSNCKIADYFIEVPEQIKPLTAEPAEKADLEIMDKEEDVENSIVNAHAYAIEKTTGHLSRQSRKQKQSFDPDNVTKRTPTKLEMLQSVLLKDSSGRTSEEKDASNGRKRRKDLEAISEEQVAHCNFIDDQKGLKSSLKSEGNGIEIAEAVEVHKTLLIAKLKGRKKRNLGMELISQRQVIQHSFADERKVSKSSMESPGKGIKFADTVKSADTVLDPQLVGGERITEDSVIHKARDLAISDPKVLGSRTQVLQRERKRMKIQERTNMSKAQSIDTEITLSDILLELSDHKRRHSSKPLMKVKNKPQAKQIAKIGEVINQSKSNLFLEPKVQTLEDKCLELVVFQGSCLTEETDFRSSPIDKPRRRRKFEIAESIANRKLYVCSEVSASISQRPGKKRLSLSSPVDDKELSIVPFKLEKMHDKLDGTMDSQDVKSLSPLIKDVENLTVKDLRILAKKQKLKGYSKLRKEELRKCLRI